MKSPDALNLPLTAQFASGELIARSGWKAGDTVFGCYFNVPTKVSAHKRRESGNFVFGYNGFPIVVHSGNTNLYRRPIHQLSIRTSAANTVTVDGAEVFHSRCFRCPKPCSRRKPCTEHSSESGVPLSGERNENSSPSVFSVKHHDACC